MADGSLRIKVNTETEQAKKKIDVEFKKKYPDFEAG